MRLALAVAVSAVALSALAVSAEEWTVASPDGRLSITLARAADGRLSWRAARGGATVIADSPLGLRRADQAFTDGLKLLRASAVAPVDEAYDLPHGKRRHHVVKGREQTVELANAAGARLAVVLRAHDDGVAFRFRFPETDSTTRTIVEEQASLHVPPGATGWMLPHQPPGKYAPAYEDLFREVPAGTTAPTPSGWSFPALFKTADGVWMLVTEAALDGTYCGSRLAAEAPGGAYRLRFPEAGEGNGVGGVNPTSTLPWTLPWRVVIVGDAAARILESDLVDDLSPASRLTDTSWVRPGRASWSWWSESDSPKHAEALNRFVDLAAEMGWEYSLVDANWNFMETGRIEDVIAHAKEKGIGLLFWYNSGGPHNEVTEAPRDRMFARESRRAEMGRLRDWGVKGIKVDFWQSDKQDRIRQYRDVLADAADFGLMVNFHGCTLPRGWSREFPNLVGMEGVQGAEQYKFNAAYPERAPWHNTVLPFTRNVVGPMDYTPVTFSDHQHPHRTTSAHELALSVVFETPIQHFADSAAAYRALPEAAKAFLKAVPTVWDETRALGGEPGRSVVVARRAGDGWWVGGISGQASAQTLSVTLPALGPGPWTMTLIRDGDQDRALQAETRPVKAGEVVTVPVRARGGFVMRIQR